MTQIDNQTRATAVQLADMFDVFQRDYMTADEQINTDPLRYETNRDVFMLTFLRVKSAVSNEIERRDLDTRQSHADNLPRPQGELRSMWRKLQSIHANAGIGD